MLPYATGGSTKKTIGEGSTFSAAGLVAVQLPPFRTLKSCTPAESPGMLTCSSVSLTNFTDVDATPSTEPVAPRSKPLPVTVKVVGTSLHRSAGLIAALIGRPALAARPRRLAPRAARPAVD